MRNIDELMYDLEECKLEVESVLWEVYCDMKGIENIEDIDDRLLLIECMSDFYGGDNWDLFKWWIELEDVFEWLYDMKVEEYNSVLERVDRELIEAVGEGIYD